MLAVGSSSKAANISRQRSLADKILTWFRCLGMNSQIARGGCRWRIREVVDRAVENESDRGLAYTS